MLNFREQLEDLKEWKKGKTNQRSSKFKANEMLQLVLNKLSNIESYQYNLLDSPALWIRILNEKRIFIDLLTPQEFSDYNHTIVTQNCENGSIAQEIFEELKTILKKEQFNLIEKYPNSFEAYF